MPQAVGAGQFGNAFTLTGPSISPIYLTNLHSMDNNETGLPIYGAGAYTISLWVKGPAQTNRYILSEASLAHAAPAVLLRTHTAHPYTDRISVLIRNNRNQSLVANVFSTNTVFDNTWHHVALVDDWGKVKLYIDGVEDPASTNAAFNYVRVHNDLSPLNTLALGTLVASNSSATFATWQPAIATSPK